MAGTTPKLRDRIHALLEDQTGKAIALICRRRLDKALERPARTPDGKVFVELYLEQPPRFVRLMAERVARCCLDTTDVSRRGILTKIMSLLDEHRTIDQLVDLLRPGRLLELWRVWRQPGFRKPGAMERTAIDITDVLPICYAYGKSVSNEGNIFQGRAPTSHLGV